MYPPQIPEKHNASYN